MKNTDEKAVTVEGVTYRYSTKWIYSLETEEHWGLYWRQQKVMQGAVSPGQNVLEIGVGSGFTANYLRSKGVKVTTLDIDADKSPDIVANIVTYDFEKKYDHVLAFEVFEHIPFEEFSKSLVKIGHVCNNYLFMSVPRNERVWFRVGFKLPKLGEHSIELATSKGNIMDKHHYWEVDHGEITLKKLKHAFDQAGFQLCHREKAFSRVFFVLKSTIA
ncbi:MAG: methyltransferase domain-containing protein [Proteobacteria bacterium]|nr:methyltransferase domain-containing protein [Pseudomonadota bacterium]